MFASDAAAFLEDDGQAVSWTPSAGGPALQGLMLFDHPDAELHSGQVISREYEATFETAAWPGLKRDEVLAIAGSSYRLRTDPQRVADGVFSTVRLTKV